MRVEQVADGIWWWTALHPEWLVGTPDQEVSSYLVETPDAVVLLDPQAPPAASDEADRFWRHLDQDVARLGRPVWVILTKEPHERDSAAFAERYAGATIHRPYLPGERALPAGVRARRVAGEDDDAEAAILFEAHDALAVGDLLMGRADGLHVWYWYDHEAGRRHYHEQHLPGLRQALEGDYERVLVAHGEPVRRGGRAAVRAALERPPRSMRYGAVTF
jgi:hypothetical protein